MLAAEISVFMFPCFFVELSHTPEHTSLATLCKCPDQAQIAVHPLSFHQSFTVYNLVSFRLGAHGVSQSTYRADSVLPSFASRSPTR
jgi:hypothetical protein